MGLLTKLIGVPVSSQIQDTINVNKQNYLANLSDASRNAISNFTSNMATFTEQITHDTLDRIKVMTGQIMQQDVIEYLPNLFSLKTCNEFTAQATMCDPTIAKMHELGQIEGYGLEYRPVFNELLNSRITSGFGGLDGTKNYKVVNYADNYQGEDVKKYDGLSSFSKRMIHHNRNLAITAAFRDEEDFSSSYSNGF